MAVSFKIESMASCDMMDNKPITPMTDSEVQALYEAHERNETQEQELAGSLSGAMLYAGLERGDPKVPGKPCNLQYLLALAKDLFKTGQEFVLWGSAHHDKAAMQRMFTAIVKELYRLHKNPDLIPDHDVRHRFWKMVVGILSEFPSFEEVKDEENHFTHNADHLRLDRAQQARDCRGVFDHRRTLWHQFMHHMAPGIGGLPPLNPRTTLNETITKVVIPPGGLEIMRKWESSIEDIRSKTTPDQPYPGHSHARPSTQRLRSIYREGRNVARHVTLTAVPDKLGLKANYDGLIDWNRKPLLEDMLVGFSHMKVDEIPPQIFPGALYVVQRTV